MRAKVLRFWSAACSDPLSSVLVCILAFFVLLPVWIARYVPLLDYPGHLINLFIWRHLNDPAFDFGRYYQMNLLPLPYWVQFGLSYLLAIPFGEEAAQKLFLSLCLLGLPIAVALYARQLGRDPRVAFLTVPLVWNMNVAHGFLAFVGGLPLLFFSLLALDRLAQRVTIPRLVVTCVLALSLYFAHLLIWGCFLVLGGLTVLWRCRPFAAARRWSFVPAGLPLLLTALLGVLMQRVANAGAANLPIANRGFSAYQGVYNGPIANLQMFPDWAMNMLPGSFDDRVCAGGLLALWLVLFIAQLVRAIAQRLPIRRWLGRMGPAELGFLGICALYFSLPRSLIRPFYWYAINRRLAVLVAVFLILLLRGSWRRSALHRVVLVAVSALTVVYTAAISRAHLRFNQRAQAFDQLLALVPPRKTVLPLMIQPGDPNILPNCFNQWGSYVQLRQGGYMIPYFPVEFPLKRRPTRVPTSPAWDAPLSFRFAVHEAGWDYFLLHGTGGEHLFSEQPQRVRLVAQRGDWTLYEKRPPPLVAPTPPANP